MTSNTHNPCCTSFYHEICAFNDFFSLFTGSARSNTGCMHGSRFRISRFFASWKRELLHCCSSVDFDFDFSYVNIMKVMHAQIIHRKSKIVTRF